MAQNKSQSTPKPVEKLTQVSESMFQALQSEFANFRSDSVKFQELVTSRFEKIDKAQEEDRQSVQRTFTSIEESFRAFRMELVGLNRGRTVPLSTTTISGTELQEIEKPKKGKRSDLDFLSEEDEHHDGYETPDDDTMLEDMFKNLSGKSIYTIAAEEVPFRKLKSGKSNNQSISLNTSSEIGKSTVGAPTASSNPTKSDGTTAKRMASTVGGNPGDGGGGDDDDDDDPPRNPRNLPFGDPKKKRDRRRTSHFVDLIAATDNRNLAQVNITRVQAPYDHIVLKQLRIMHAVRFFDQFKTYQFVNNVQLAMTHQVSDGVRKQILAHHPKLTLQAFYMLTNEQLITLIQTHVRPKTTLEFLRVLRDYLEFKYEGRDAPSPTSFLPFYTSLLLYRDDFYKLYDVISARNDHIIPPSTDKEGGLIKLFIEKISFNYGKLLYRSLKQTKFDDINDFIDDFYVVVEKDYRLSQAARSVMEHFGGTEYEVKSGQALAFRSGSFTRTNDRNNDTNRSGTVHGKNNDIKKKYTSNHKLQTIRAAGDSDDEIDPGDGLITPDIDDDLVSDDGMDNTSPKKSVAKKLDASEDEDDPAPYMQPAKVAEDLDDSKSDSDEPDDSDDRIIAAMESHHNANSNSNGMKSKTANNAVGCFFRLTGRPCKLGDKCRFSHDYKDLVKAYEYYQTLLAQSKYKPPTGILRKAGTKA